MSAERTDTNGAAATTPCSRRDFLAGSAAAGAGLILTTAAGLDAQVTAAGGELRIALIGAGKQGGGVLMPNTLKIPGIKFQAVCDIWPYNQTKAYRLLKRMGHPVTAYVDYREMLAKEKGLHAAIVAVPDWLHADVACACLKAGLHVYCEKEMSNSLEKAAEMVKTAKTTARLLQIGHQRRSNPFYQHAKDKIIDEAKLLGRLTHGYGQWNKSVSAPIASAPRIALDAATLAKYGYGSMKELENWRWYKKYGGGPIVDLGSHQIDIFAWFFGGPPKSVMASGGNDYYQGWEWPDNVLAIYEFDTPAGVARAYYQVLTTSSARGFYETFTGDEGTMQISEIASKNRIYAEGRIGAEEKWDPWVKKGYISLAEVEEKKEEPKDGIVALYKSDPVVPYLFPVDPKVLTGDPTKPPHQPHLENFFDSVRGTAKLNCPAEVGYETAVMVLKVHEAIEAGRRLDFKKEDFHV